MFVYFLFDILITEASSSSYPCHTQWTSRTSPNATAVAPLPSSSLSGQLPPATYCLPLLLLFATEREPGGSSAAGCSAWFRHRAAAASSAPSLSRSFSFLPSLSLLILSSSSLFCCKISSSQQQTACLLLLLIDLFLSLRFSHKTDNGNLFFQSSSHSWFPSLTQIQEWLLFFFPNLHIARLNRLEALCMSS